MNFDLPDAKLPDLQALQRSWVANDPLAEGMNQLTVQLWRDNLAEQTFDINVLGAPHLGSFSLVRRAVNADGLALLSGEGEESATRYLYRAWKGQNGNGRGLHFLRTYMQMLYPNKWSVAQMWQNTSLPYTVGMQTEQELDSPFGPGKSGWALTSRVHIGIDYDAPLATSFSEMLKVLANVLPARIVPEFATRVLTSVGGSGSAKAGAGVRAIGLAKIRPEIVMRAQSATRVHAHAIALARIAPDVSMAAYSGRVMSSAAAPVLRIGSIPPWQEWHLPKPAIATRAKSGAAAIAAARYAGQPTQAPVATRVHAHAIALARIAPGVSAEVSAGRVMSSAAAPVLRIGSIPPWQEWHLPKPAIATRAKSGAAAIAAARYAGQPTQAPVATRIGARAFVVVRAGSIPDWTEWHAQTSAGTADDFYAGLVTGYATGASPHWSHGEDSDMSTVQLLNRGMLPF